jgi:hypothetical protein
MLIMNKIGFFEKLLYYLKSSDSYKKFTNSLFRKSLRESLKFYDPGGYRWPPTFSNWLKTVFWQFW